MLRQAKRLLRAERAAAPVLPIVPGWVTAAGHLSARLCCSATKTFSSATNVQFKSRENRSFFRAILPFWGRSVRQSAEIFVQAFFRAICPLEIFGKRI